MVLIKDFVFFTNQKVNIGFILSFGTAFALHKFSV